MKRTGCVTKRRERKLSIEPEPIVKHATGNTTKERQTVRLTAFCAHQKKLCQIIAQKKDKLLVIMRSY